VEYNRQIRKLQFERKLDAAEKAIGFYSSYIGTIIEIKISLEVILNALKEDRDIDVAIIQSVLDQNSLNLTDLMKRGHVDSNTVHLYFDLEDKNLWDEDDIYKFIETLSEVKYIDNDIQFWIDLYNHHLEKGEDKEAEIFWKKAQDLLGPYSKSLEKLVDSFQSNKQAVKILIDRVKTQVSKDIP